MVGNREVTEGQRRAYWSDYQKSRKALPQKVTRLIDRIHRLNETSAVGFRRRNLPALLAHYFSDMCQILQNISACLKNGGMAYIVIGNNHTIAGGQRVDIKTDELLGEMAGSIGLVLEETIPMEMLLSRDIFKNNAVASETILCLRKSTQGSL
jgi:site-specific DNA-methyltransferase (cytosine-N4-specific)